VANYHYVADSDPDSDPEFEQRINQAFHRPLRISLGPRPRSPIPENPIQTPGPRNQTPEIPDQGPLLLEELQENMAQPAEDPMDLLRALQAQLIALQGTVNQQNTTIAQQNAQIANIPAAAANPAPAQPRIKPDRPPPFSGKKSENLEAWIFQMQQYCDLAPIPEADRIPFAATFLKDQAALWWRSYYHSVDWANAAPNWDGFLDALRQQFIPVNTSINAYDRLQRLSQRASVNAYNHEFRAVMLELPDMDQATRMNYYLRGLKDNLRPFVAMQQPANLATAEAIAERVDAVTFKPANRGTGFRPNPTYRTPGGTTPMELDAITKLTQTERERLRKEGGCFRCRKPGHLARDCTMTNRTHPRINVIDEDPEESGKE